MKLRTLRCHDDDDNENVKKAIVWISKTTTLHVHLAFLYISLPSLRDYDGKMPNVTFYGGRKQATAKFSVSFWTWIWFLGIRLKKSLLAFHKVNEFELCAFDYFFFRKCAIQLLNIIISSNHDRDWKNANSLCKRRFRGRGRRGILPWKCSIAMGIFIWV